MSVFNIGSGTSEQVYSLCDSERGLRQGDALFTMLLNIVLEKVKGILGLILLEQFLME